MTSSDRTGGESRRPHYLQQAAWVVAAVAVLSVLAINVDGAAGLPIPKASLLLGGVGGGLLAGVLEIGAGLSAIKD